MSVEQLSSAIRVAMRVIAGLAIAVALTVAIPASGADGQTMQILVNPAVIQPVNGKLPATVNLAIAEANCDSSTKTPLSKDDKVQITGGGLSASAVTSADACWVMTTVTVDPNTPPGKNKVVLTDKNGNILGSANLVVLDATAGAIPPGLPPQVDVMWQVMAENNCADVFGKRVSQTEYCIQVRIGNNSGYPLQLAGIGFTTKVPELLGMDGLDVTISNNSYASTRAILVREQYTNFRNILYNSLQAAGVLMGAFTPYFHNVGHAGNWTTAASIVAGPLLSAFNTVMPNPVITQLNNLDDESFRDSKVIPNNTQILTVIFVDKQAMTLKLATLNKNVQGPLNGMLTSKEFTAANDQQKAILTSVAAQYQAAANSTVRNSTNPDVFNPFTKKGNFDPLLVKLALGNLVIVGQQIEYLQRVQITSAASSSNSGPLQATPATVSLTAAVFDSKSQSITLTNSGSSQLAGVSATPDGTNKDDFTPAADNCKAIDAGANCAISVTFSPKAKQSPDRTATLKISYTGASTPLQVPLTGTASFPGDKVAVSAAPSLSAAAGASAKGTVTVGNMNASAITIDKATLSGVNPAGSFTVSNDGCSGSLDTEKTCTIEVTFTAPKPAPAAAPTATLVVNYHVNGGTATQNVSLKGSVTAAQ